jgi:hypothetical protein
MMQSSSYLLRVRLPDRPGVLGQVATALGAAGADIDSIVVVDRTGGSAVDDLVVSLPAGRLADRLVSAATSVAGVHVEALQRHHGRRRIHDDLTLLDRAASADRPLDALVDGLPDLMQVSYALVVAGDGDEVRGVVASPSAPVEGLTGGWLPITVPSVLDAEQIWNPAELAGPDCELIGAPFAAAAVLLGRIGGPAFLPAELTRLAHLARVAQALLPDLQ